MSDGRDDPCDPPTGDFASLGIVGRSPAIRQLHSIVRRVAGTDSTILIQGETGTGKGIVASAIHQLSPRRTGPLVAVNCGAIPESLLESELFGHVKGAFTGATANKTGKFERAAGGTIFLDEIGDMSPLLQVKILRVLEEGEFEPVGGNRIIRSDARVIAATHRDLEKQVEKGRFREDLFYRIFVIPVTIPPLRERRSDIPPLAAHFIRIACEKTGCDLRMLDDAAMERLSRYSWPGNVRELRNLMERLVVLSDATRILTSDLPMKINGSEPHSSVMPAPTLSEEGISLNAAVTEFEKTLILQSLEKSRWVKNRAAKLLHLNRTTLVEKIKRHRLDF
ncbi:MAG: sigma-54 interaction domain-containing protein [Desulfobacterales bacterium]